MSCEPFKEEGCEAVVASRSFVSHAGDFDRRASCTAVLFAGELGQPSCLELANLGDLMADVKQIPPSNFN
jgi:hypothetical protein